MILGIDPGPEQIGFCWYDAGKPGMPGILSVPEFLSLMREGVPLNSVAVIEWIECYGMAVGAEVFQTCAIVGRLQEIFDRRGVPHILMPRRIIKQHLCHGARATDANIRQALIDRFGPGREKAIGTKKKPGPLYGVKSHAWAALALAVTQADREAAQE